MYSFDHKKWTRFVFKQALYPFISVTITLIIFVNALQKVTILELLRETENGFSGILILVLLFITWVTLVSRLEDRKRKDFPTFSITPDYLSLINGLSEERVRTQHAVSFEIVKKRKKLSHLSINLSDGSSIFLEKFFPLEVIAIELRKMGIDEL
jgi:hypothetical protein